MLRELGFRLTFDSEIKKIKDANTAFDKMEQEARQAGKGVSDLEGQSKKLGGSLRGLKGLMAGVFAGLSVKAGFNFFVQGNAEMEQYRNTLNIVMKDTKKANETLAWATKFAASTPFEVPGIVEATTRLTTYGLEAQSTLPIIGDMAATMGKDIMQAVEAVADAQTGELERLKEFGITKSMLQEQADAMGIVFQNNKGQITSYENLNTALFAIMEDRYKGSMEIQSKTFRGMVSNAQDMMGAIGRTVGEPIFEAFKDSLENILEIGQNLLDSGQIEKWAKNVANGIENLIGFVEDVGNAFAWAKENIDALTPVAISIGVAIAAVMTPAIIAWTTATTAAAIAQWALIAPILATVAPILAVGAVIGGLIYVWKTYGDSIKTYVSEAWHNVQTTFNNMISFVSGINLWEIGANMIRGLVDGMLSMLDSAMETAKNIGSGIANTLKNFFQINSPSKLMFSYGGYIGQGLDLGMQSETDNLKATGQSMAKATDIGQGLDLGMQSKESNLGNTAEGMGRTTESNLAGSITNSSSFFGVQSVKGNFINTATAIKSAFESVNLFDAGSNIIKGLIGGMNSMLDLGVQSKTSGLEATSQGMAEATNEQFTNAITNEQFTSTTSNSSTSYAPSINITVNGNGGGARETASSVRREVESVLSAYEKKMMLRWGAVNG